VENNTEPLQTPVSDFAPASHSSEKKLIISLIALVATLSTGLLALLFVVPYYGFGRISPYLPTVMGVITALVCAAVLFSLGLLIVVVALGRDVPFSRTIRSVALKVLLPVLVGVGKLAGIKREQVQHAFVAVNNELVLAHCRNGSPPRSILLLMPHCLQNSDCKVKITYRVENCKRCGKCRIKDLLELTEKYGVGLAVATGGTIARRIVLERRPDLIIAVACERDLTSGIQDTSPLPVYGIFNQRPFGPCFNTQVSIDRVESVLKEMCALQNAEVNKI
jgi:hypothetical protein